MTLKVGLLFFAYGCHMDASHLAGVVGIELAPGWPARLDGWRLAFNHRDEDGSIVASIVPAPNCLTCGVVYRLPREALSVLDDYEGAPDDYRRETLWVEPLGRVARQAALVYVGQDSCRVDDGRPEERYLNLLTGGAEAHGLPADYVGWLGVRARGETEDCYGPGQRMGKFGPASGAH